MYSSDYTQNTNSNKTELVHFLYIANYYELDMTNSLNVVSNKNLCIDV